MSTDINLCDEVGHRLIPIFVVKKPKSTITVIKENISNEEFLVRILGEEAYGGLHRLEIKIGERQDFSTLTSSDDGNFLFFGRGAYRIYKHNIES